MLQLKLFQFVVLALILPSVVIGESLAFAALSDRETQLLKERELVYLAQEEDFKRPQSYEEILEAVMLRNAELEAAFYEWKAAVHGIRQARSFDDPELTFRTFLKEVHTRVGPQRQVYGIGQMLPFPGKLYTKGQVASAEARQFYGEFLKKQLEVLYEIKDAYLEYWFLRKTILVTESNMDILTRFENVAQSRFKSAQTSNQDLLKAQVELGKLQNELLTLQDYRIPVVARINALLNRQVSETLEWPDEIPFELADLSLEAVLETFRQNNPDIFKAERRIEEAQKKVRLARLDFLPDLMLGFDWIHIDKGPMPSPENGEDAASLMFKINMPLWYGKQKSQLDEAKANEKAATAARRQLEHDLAAKVAMVFFQVKDARRQILLYRDALLPKAEQLLGASETAYSSGEVDFQHLIDSERTLLNFQLDYYRAIRNYEQRMAELEMIVGEPLRGTSI